MNNEVGFARKVLQVLEDENVSLEHMPTGIDTLSVVVANSQIEGKLDRVLKKLQLACNPDSIEVFSDMALIATVGHGMIRRVGISAKLFSALADAGVNVRLIDQGSSELNIIVGLSLIHIWPWRAFRRGGGSGWKNRCCQRQPGV